MQHHTTDHLRRPGESYRIDQAAARRLAVRTGELSACLRARAVVGYCEAFTAFELRVEDESDFTGAAWDDVVLRIGTTERRYQVKRATSSMPWSDIEDSVMSLAMESSPSRQYVFVFPASFTILGVGTAKHIKTLAEVAREGEGFGTDLPKAVRTTLNKLLAKTGWSEVSAAEHLRKVEVLFVGEEKEIAELALSHLAAVFDERAKAVWEELKALMVEAGPTTRVTPNTLGKTIHANLDRELRYCGLVQFPAVGGLHPTAHDMLIAEYELLDYIDGIGSVSPDEICAAAQGPVSLIFLSGEAGVGKSRLAAEACRRLSADGMWTCARLDWPISSDSLAELQRDPRPLVVVIDYVERRDDVGRVLGALVRPPGEARRVVLCLARDVTPEWWQGLALLHDDAVLRRALASAVRLELFANLVGNTSQVQRLYDAACRCLERLHGDEPALPSGSNRLASCQTPLEVVLSACATRGGGGTSPLHEVVDRELRDWWARVQERSSDVDKARFLGEIAPGLAALQLFDVGLMFTQSPKSLLIAWGLSEAEAAIVDDALSRPALRNIYPAMRPDALRKELVRRFIASGRMSVSGVVRMARTFEQGPPLARAFDILDEIGSAGEAAAGAYLDALLQIPGTGQFEAAVLSVIRRSSLGTPLAAMLPGHLARSGDAELAERLLDIVPRESVRLAEVGLWAAETVPGDLPTELMSRLGAVGRMAEAVALARDFIFAHEHDAGATEGGSFSDAVKKNLMLQDARAAFSVAQHNTEALALAEIAAELLEKAAEAQPEPRLHYHLVAREHTVVAQLCEATGDLDRALEFVEKAVARLVEITGHLPDEPTVQEYYRDALASSASILGAHGRAAEAEIRSGEAVRLSRLIFAREPDKHLGIHVQTLRVRARVFERRGEREEARACLDEAIAVCDPAASIAGGRWAELLASLLNNRSCLRLGPAAEDLAFAKRAVRLREQVYKSVRSEGAMERLLDSIMLCVLLESKRGRQRKAYQSIRHYLEVLDVSKLSGRTAAANRVASQLKTAAALVSETDEQLGRFLRVGAGELEELYPAPDWVAVDTRHGRVVARAHGDGKHSAALHAAAIHIAQRVGSTEEV